MLGFGGSEVVFIARLRFCGIFVTPGSRIAAIALTRIYRRDSGHRSFLSMAA